MQEELKAKTSEVPYYSKIDYRFLDRIAVALTAGSNEYDPHVLVENWRLGDVKFFYKRANNGIRHIFKWLDGDRSEDHLAHAACNLMMLMWGEEQQIYNPQTPEIRTLQYINFVKQNQAAKTNITTPGMPTKVGSQKMVNVDVGPTDEMFTVAGLVGLGRLPDGSGLDAATGRVTVPGEPEEIEVDKIDEAGISHVDITGKPVFSLEKVKEILLG